MNINALPTYSIKNLCAFWQFKQQSKTHSKKYLKIHFLPCSVLSDAYTGTLFVLGLAVFWTVQQKLHVWETGLTKALQQNVKQYENHLH